MPNAIPLFYPLSSTLGFAYLFNSQQIIEK